MTDVDTTGTTDDTENAVESVVPMHGALAAAETALADLRPTQEQPWEPWTS